ncbi:hypothetical protein C8C85_0836 [Flavobacterium sp. 103]|nr:hypothetical protein C8C85_0836 [Flavobacterium sp. 103]
MWGLYYVVASARGIEASYQSSAYSPTAVEKGANKRYCGLAPFSTGGSPKLFGRDKLWFVTKLCFVVCSINCGVFLFIRFYPLPLLDISVK